MALTAYDALRHVKHALSSEELPSVGGQRILNDAGEYMVGMHPWKWLEGTQSYVDLNKDQDHIWLPENLREVMSIVATDGLNLSVSMTTPQELAIRRASTVNTALHYWVTPVWQMRGRPKHVFVKSTQTVEDNVGPTISDGSLSIAFRSDASRQEPVGNTYYFKRGAGAAETTENLVAAINASDLSVVARIEQTSTYKGGFRVTGTYSGAADRDYWAFNTDTMISAGVDEFPGVVGGAPQPRLDLWPTPTAYKKDAMVVYYRRGWETIRHDDQAIGVPTWLESLYLACVRAVALGYERDNEADVNARLSMVRRGPLFNDAARRDSLLVTTLGAMQGGAVQYDNGINPMWNFDNINNPVNY